MSGSLKRNSLLSAVKALVSILFPMVTFPYASRILLPEGIGIVNFSNAVIDVFLLIAGFGISNYATREGARIRNNQHLFDKFVREMLCINITSMLISYALFFLALFFVPQFYSLKQILLITSIKMISESTGLGWVLSVKEDFKAITLRSIVFQLASITFLLIFVHSPDDLWKYAVMGIIYSVGINVFSIFYVRKYVNLFGKYKIEIKKHLKKLVIFFGIAVSVKIYSLTDSIMLGFISSTIAVGFYAAANKLINMVLSIMVSVFSVFLPRCTNYIAEKKYDEYSHVVRKALNTTVFYSIPAATGLFVLCEPLIKTFSGDSFLHAVPAMKLLCLLVILNALIEGVQALILLPQNKEKYALIGQNIAGFLNLIINIPLIISFNVTGAAVATVISQSVIFIFYILFARKYICSKSFIINFVQVLIGSALMFFTVKQLYLLNLNKYQSVFLGILAGSLIYGIVLFLLRNRIALGISDFIVKKIMRIFGK